MTPAAAARATPLRVAVTSAVDVCALVEDLGREAVGELALEVGGVRRGAVFVECGRVCWAAAPGLAARLTELLVAHTGAPARAVEDVVVDCIADGAPFGERLVEVGLVDAAQLRATLLQHAAESLAAACHPSACGTWVPRRQRGYASRYTFTAAEILACTLALEYPAAAAVARAVLTSAFEPNEGAAAYVRRADRGAPQPVAIAGSWDVGPRGLLRAGRWAASALDVSAHDGAAPFIAVSRGDVSFVAWSARSLLIVGATTELGAARLLRHARAREEADHDADL